MDDVIGDMVLRGQWLARRTHFDGKHPDDEQVDSMIQSLTEAEDAVSIRSGCIQVTRIDLEPERMQVDFVIRLGSVVT